MLQLGSVWRVASLFFSDPRREFELLELSRASSLAHTSVKRHLATLEQLGIISVHVEQKGQRSFPRYRASLNEPFQHAKRFSNHYSISASGIVEHLIRELSPDVIVLFGSYERGEDDAHSDIDLFVQAEPRRIDLSRFENQLGRPIELHMKRSFSGYPAELKTNIINGLVLFGYLEAQ